MPSASSRSRYSTCRWNLSNRICVEVGASPACRWPPLMSTPLRGLGSRELCVFRAWWGMCTGSGATDPTLTLCTQLVDQGRGLPGSWVCVGRQGAKMWCGHQANPQGAFWFTGLSGSAGPIVVQEWITRKQVQTRSLSGSVLVPGQEGTKLASFPEPLCACVLILKKAIAQG